MRKVDTMAMHCRELVDGATATSFSRCLTREPMSTLKVESTGMHCRQLIIGGTATLCSCCLKKGANVNAQGGYYGNALLAALSSGQGYQAVVQLLLSYNAAVNQRDTQGRTSFRFACGRGRMTTINALLSFGSDRTTIDAQGRDGLIHAACSASTNTFKWLLKEGFDPNYTDRDGWTSLHSAAKKGSADTVEVLKAAGTVSKIEAINNWTPDLVAAFHHNNLSDDLSDSAIEPEEDGRITIRGLWRNGLSCKGCYLVISNLKKLLYFFV